MVICDNMYLARIVLLFCYYECSAQLVTILVKSPNNTLVFQEGIHQVECQGDGIAGTDINWSECITSGSCERINYQSSIIHGEASRAARYSVSDPPTMLNVTGVLLEDGGQYQCQSQAKPALIAYAELLVFAGDPTCSWNVTSSQVTAGDLIQMECLLTYQGRWAPTFTWYSDGVPMSGEETPLSNITTQYSLLVVASPADDGAEYSVSAALGQPADPFGPDEATNIPHYNFSQVFGTLEVFYAPYNLTITPVGVEYLLGDILTCEALANPTPTYQWTDTMTSAVLSGTQELTITSGMEGYSNLTCTASNGHGSDSITLDFAVSAMSTLPSTIADTTADPTTLEPTIIERTLQTTDGHKNTAQHSTTVELNKVESSTTESTTLSQSSQLSTTGSTLPTKTSGSTTTTDTSEATGAVGTLPPHTPPTSADIVPTTTSALGVSVSAASSGLCVLPMVLTTMICTCL